MASHRTPPSSQNARAGRRARTTARVAIGTVAALTLAACVSPPPPATVIDPADWVTTTPAGTGDLGTVTWNLMLEPSNLDPAESSNYGESIVLANLCESLQTLNPDFTITDGLAALTANEDRTRLVYTIDPAARFWDGTPVTGMDAAFSLTRIWHPTGVPTWTSYFDAVTAIDATGEREVTITLSHPDLLLEKLLATSAGAVVKQEFVETAREAFGTASVGPMCSGPYSFASWRPGSNLTIKRNDAYWGPVTAKAAQVEFSFLQGDATQTTALTGDAIQGMYQPPYSALQQLATHGELYLGDTLLMFYLIPTRKPGPLQDPRIREALFLALNRQAVADTAFSGSGKAAQSLLPSSGYGGVTATTTTGTGGSEEELARARALVEEAGSPQETIVLAANTGITESMNRTLQALVEAGDKIGLNMEFKGITLGEFYGLFGDPEGWRAVDADGFGSQPFLPVADPMAQYVVWQAPDRPDNYGGFSDAASAELITAAGESGDPTTRDELLGKADEALFGQMPWVPIVEVANTLYMNDQITGPPASFVQFFYPWATHLAGTD